MHNKKNIRAVGTALTLAMTGFSLAACGGGATATPSSSTYDCAKPNATTVTDISVVAMPILSSASLFLGRDKGIFEKHGLKPAFEMVSSPPAGVSALMGGNADFAWTTTATLLQAVDQGQKIKGVSPFAGIEPGYWDKMQAGVAGYTKGIQALLVQQGSGIESPGDLGGKTVAVPDPVFGKMMAQSLIKSHGGDPDAAKYVIMPSADAYQAILAGKVDAAMSVDPIIRGWEEKGLKNLSWTEVEVFHDGPMSFMVATDDYITKNAETVARFNCVISESSAYTNEHPDQAREITAREQGIDPAALKTAIVPYYFTESNVEGVRRVQEKMMEFKYLKSEMSPDTYLASTALPKSGS